MTVPRLLPLAPPFLARLAGARELASALFRGVHPRAALAGAPADFDGHRPYAPGDDIRWIDWNLYARHEGLFVKVFRMEEEVEVLLLVDASPSMSAGGGAKYRVAAAAAAAFAYLAVVTGRPVTVCRYAERLLDAVGPHRSPEGFQACTRLLLSPAGGAATDLERSLVPQLRRVRRPLTVIALSDGFQEQPLERAFAAARLGEQRRLILVRVADPADLRPRLRGTLVALDPESADSRVLVGDRGFERLAHERIRAHLDGLESALRAQGVVTLSLPADAPFEEAFLALIASPAAASLEGRR